MEQMHHILYYLIYCSYLACWREKTALVITYQIAMFKTCVPVTVVFGKVHKQNMVQHLHVDRNVKCKARQVKILITRVCYKFLLFSPPTLYPSITQKNAGSWKTQ
jgi:hypothetical protein